MELNIENPLFSDSSNSTLNVNLRVELINYNLTPYEYLFVEFLKGKKFFSKIELRKIKTKRGMYFEGQHLKVNNLKFRLVIIEGEKVIRRSSTYTVTDEVQQMIKWDLSLEIENVDPKKISLSDKSPSKAVFNSKEIFNLLDSSDF